MDNHQAEIWLRMYEEQVGTSIYLAKSWGL